MSNDMLRKVFNKLEAQRLKLHEIAKDLDNRDLPRYNKLKELLGIAYMDWLLQLHSFLLYTSICFYYSIYGTTRLFRRDAFAVFLGSRSPRFFR